MQSWSAMPVIDLSSRSLHYLYSSWLNVTLYAWQMLTDKQTLSTPEHVQQIWQGCPLTLGIKPL